MGCDGGTIPRRDELVRTKKKPEQKDKNTERSAKWKHCAISQEALRSPIMACELGRLYNKESVIEFLLDRSQFEMAENFSHLRGLKDIKELSLTTNPDSVKHKAENGDTYMDVHRADFICPVTGLEMNGKYGFNYIWSCGCVVSERALKEVKSDVCHKCGVQYSPDDVITLNGSEETVEKMKTLMTARRNKHKKKSKVGFKRKEEISSTDTAASSSKTAKIDDKARDKVQKPTPSTSIQKNPNATKAYKSLFTSSAEAKSQGSAHWVTYNPMYY